MGVALNEKLKMALGFSLVFSLSFLLHGALSAHNCSLDPVDGKFSVSATF